MVKEAGNRADPPVETPESPGTGGSPNRIQSANLKGPRRGQSAKEGRYLARG